MKTLALIAAVLGMLSIASADDGLKCVVDQLDKEWGIKFKSMVMKEGVGQSYTEIRITLVFTGNVIHETEMRQVFEASGGNATKPNGHPIIFYLFDEENVSIGKYVIMRTEGDLTAVKGDAFRIFLQIDKETLKKAKKLEARLTLPERVNEVMEDY